MTCPTCKKNVLQNSTCNEHFEVDGMSFDIVVECERCLCGETLVTGAEMQRAFLLVALALNERPSTPATRTFIRKALGIPRNHTN